jgi:protein ImuA
MTIAAAAPAPEAIHPDIWLASQLGRAHTRCIDTGHPALSNQLPGGGWPTGTAVDLLVQQPGIGEIRLLAPALKQVAQQRVVLLNPPHAPQTIGLAALGLPPSSMLWLRAERTADMLWAAEQVLRSGSCGALLFWQKDMRAESMRRLHLAAQGGETLFFMMRPLAATLDASPAPLRLSVKPAPGGIDIGFVKRRGPQSDDDLFLPIQAGLAPYLRQRHAPQEGTNSVPCFASTEAAQARALFLN